MIHCPKCQKEIDEDAPSCPSCGLSFDDATRQLDSRESQARDPGRKGSTSAPSFDSIDDSRFVPGTILAERYRIVGLLGKGGMGEVYRADDLRLSQPVALKFLSRYLSEDVDAVKRLYSEVRIAARCRIRTSVGFTTLARSTVSFSSRWNLSREKSWLRCCDASAACRRTRQ